VILVDSNSPRISTAIVPRRSALLGYGTESKDMLSFDSGFDVYPGITEPVIRAELDEVVNVTV